MNFRSKKLLESARESPCMRCGAQNGTVVAAHSNQIRHGKGKGIKAHDYFVAYLCFDCHNLVDGRAGGLSREDKHAAWGDAWEKTVAYWFEKGIIK